MHPSRTVALSVLAVALLTLLQVGVAGRPRLTTVFVVRLIGAVVLLVGGLYGFVRYETDPIVTEYGPKAYLLVGAASLWAAGLVVQFLSG
jgi:predicted metal-binding membrane protein